MGGRLEIRALAITAFAATLAALMSGSAAADDKSSDDTKTEDWAIHGQTTFVEQFHPAFASPFRGRNSLDPSANGRETWDATVFLGVRPWDGAEIWVNGEVDQGFGLSNTLGIAGFPSAEAYKIGKAVPYPKLPRLFFRQTIGLSGDSETVDAKANQLGGSQVSNRIVVTIGKLAVTDIFDKNAYSNDGRDNLLNWALVNGATFDYAANAWGYTYGAAIEWYQDRWTLRGGLFDLSNVPNSVRLEETFARQFEAVAELEERHTLFGQTGSVRVLGFLNHGRMGTFSDAIALSKATGEPADIALVRHMHERSGVEINLDQQLTDDIGFFARAGYDDPSKEPFEFIDVDAAMSAGVEMKGKRWGRDDDNVALGLVFNTITAEHAAYFNRGGLGILVGDGKLPHPGDEFITELQYDLAAQKWLKLSADYQFVLDPAYNRDRGPVSVLGARVHAEF